MPRKKPVVRKKNRKNKDKLRQELKQDIIAIALISLGLFVGLCLWQVPAQGKENLLGALGSWVYKYSLLIFGSGNWFLVLMLILLGSSRWFGGVGLKPLIISAYLLVTLSICSIAHLLLPIADQTISAGLEGIGGGIIGAILVQSTNYLIGNTGSWILFVSIMIISFLIITNRTIKEILESAGSKAKELAQNAQDEYSQIVSRRQERKLEDKKNRDKGIMKSLNLPIETDLRSDHNFPLYVNKKNRDNINKAAGIFNADDSNLTQPTIPGTLAADVIAASMNIPQENPATDIGVKPATEGWWSQPNNPEAIESNNNDKENSAYVLPPLSLLKNVQTIKSKRLNKDITNNVRILEETLGNFGVKAVVTQVNRGPSITRYELQPSPGVKVSKIVNLADDIALALAASHVRIEAPIPGKAAVGIEVPNAEMTPVGLREVLEDGAFINSKSKLTFALGKDIAGQAIVADLAKMPHLLIAGSTGSGKSVCMNALIASILFNTHPDEVKLMMIDPKIVELSNYNGIPHLIHPVVTEPKKAATALRWAVHEMEKRYELFASVGVKDILRYNHLALEKKPEERPELIPQVIIMIDELADLMMVAPADVEDAICRLAQMARAAGMHLVVATQRPSVDVITGIIKANIPSRIAFAVSSQTDSRTILDMGGAERLLGRGDMLFYPTGQAKPLRVQGVFVSDQEIEGLTEYLKAVSKQPKYIEELVADSDQIEDKEIEYDNLLPEAAKLFIESGQASISLLQRRLRIGYTRAARIIDQMEEQGIVGGYEGSKARQIRMTIQQYEERFGSPNNTNLDEV